jgi:hypothetical protein
MDTASGRSTVKLTDVESEVLKKGGRGLWLYIKSSLDHQLDNINRQRKATRAEKSVTLTKGNEDLIAIDLTRDPQPDFVKLWFVMFSY